MKKDTDTRKQGLLGAIMNNDMPKLENLAEMGKLLEIYQN